MFNYFGSKRRLAKTYQPPKHDLIVEPFGGSAQYAVAWLVERPSLRAIVFDTDPLVIASWRRMLAATPAEILAWPVPEDGDATRDYIDQANYSGGFCPTVTGRSPLTFQQSKARWAAARSAIGDRIEWHLGDYRDAPDIEATWFVDPPYQHQGHRYNHGSEGIDYDELGGWCRNLAGQVIVSEARPADWLPFDIHKTVRGQTGGTNTELVWYSDPEPTLFD